MGKGDQEKIVFLDPDQLTDSEHYKDKDGVVLEIKDSQLLVEWFAENFKKFGATLAFVTDKSQEGSQFVQGFGGVGGILRYKFDLSSMDFADKEEFNDDEDDNLGDEWDIFY